MNLFIMIMLTGRLEKNVSRELHGKGPQNKERPLAGSWERDIRLSERAEDRLSSSRMPSMTTTRPFPLLKWSVDI